MAAYSSFNTTVTFNSQAVGEVTNISIGGSSLTEIDVTSLTDSSKTFIMGALEAGTLTVDFFAPANWADLDIPQPQSGGSSVPIVLSFAAGTLDAGFDAVVTNLSLSADQDGAVTVSATLKLQSEILWS